MEVLAMEVKLDDYGRIVIPKEVRDKLGIESGTSLEIRVEREGEIEGAITLRPKGQEPALQRKGDLLVHSGSLTEEEFDVVEQIRSGRRERARKQAGLDG
jgi:AbrB family looped-hinge helix DNA binding protein